MLVIDANAIVELILDLNSLQQNVQSQIEDFRLCAPDLVDTEVLSSFRKALFRGQVDQPRVQEALLQFLDLPIHRHSSKQLLFESLSHIFNVSAYDALYVALAEILDCPLVTLDHRLARAPGINCEVIAIA